MYLREKKKREKNMFGKKKKYTEFVKNIIQIRNPYNTETLCFKT